MVGAAVSHGTVDVRVDSVPRVSSRYGYDCYAEATALAVRTAAGTSATALSSHARVLVQLAGDCAGLRRGAALEVSATVVAAPYGTAAVWLLVDESSPVTVLAEPAPVWRAVETMQAALYRSVASLDQQGRVLVPGLTLGVLGQDALAGGDRAVAVDDSYAQMLQDQCRDAGIMHLMAVSGGHFALLASLVGLLCRWLLLSRRWRAVLTAAAMPVLAAVLVPSASVSRALAMGMLGCGFTWTGRRRQGVVLLSWTATGMLLAMPWHARDYAFALSCMAVLGITVLASPLESWLSAFVPRLLAGALAPTVSAQLFTLPIQVMMTADFPVWSTAANLMVAPVVDVATLAGLLSLFVGWWLPDAGVLFARISSYGTRVIEMTASLVASETVVTVPWMTGVAGGVVMALAEVTAATTALCLRRLWTLAVHPDPSVPGQRLFLSPAVRARLWWRETRRQLRRLHWSGQ
ncbi:ComEC/Rec2 family competence protein [Bifidobacterium choloepi]|uniref:ComEC/Rec2 family competence protein n=1 Tax=Bifidobacterium choloepi TaxID=2614131 RepID=A0A6I5MXY9_9BIFI|nr:ComEC/Rec2 family competence protein [Bifidobacterium choloepi]NEG69046.1 ComEC/Rec2 family competence protein [Bifidobacterium choloepi]